MKEPENVRQGSEIVLRVPGTHEYVLVLRLALGGVAILKDLDAGALDDLRIAADEACDCLLHQGRPVDWLEMAVQDAGDRLTVTLSALFCEGNVQAKPDPDELDVSRAVLETLIPVVALHPAPCGCVARIELTLPKAVPVGA